jgi:TonB-dependent Receptor Plug Domain
MGGMPPGSHDVVVERIGYAPLHLRLRVNAGDTAEVVFRLTPDPTQIGGVTATAAPVSQRMQAFEFRRTHHQGSGRFVTRAELDQSRQSTLSDLVRRMPGAQIVNSPSSNAKNLASGHLLAPGAMIHTARPCFSQVFVDGVQIYGPTGSARDGIEPPNLDDFHLDDLEAVEYYSTPSSTPPEFRTLTSSCGTLVLWTREAH